MGKRTWIIMRMWNHDNFEFICLCKSTRIRIYLETLLPNTTVLIVEFYEVINVQHLKQYTNISNNNPKSSNYD